MEIDLPGDDWHAHVYVHFGWLCCGKCKLEPELQWAWAGLGCGEACVAIFAKRAVEHLKSAGWIMRDDELCCPTCAKAHDFNPRGTE